MIYFLTGMPGSGKSTLGKELSKILKYRYVDLDELIEQKEGRSIPEIFGRSGQDYFRRKETEALEDIIHSKENLIVSTGGGAPCFNNNMELMNNAGKSIFIDVSADELFKRLKAGKQNRPLVQGLSDEALMSKLIQMNTERVPFYKMAHYHFKGDNLSSKEISDQLKEDSKTDHSFGS